MGLAASDRPCQVAMGRLWGRSWGRPQSHHIRSAMSCQPWDRQQSRRNSRQVSFHVFPLWKMIQKNISITKKKGSGGLSVGRRRAVMSDDRWSLRLVEVVVFSYLQMLCDLSKTFLLLCLFIFFFFLLLKTFLLLFCSFSVCSFLSFVLFFLLFFEKERIF